MNQLGFDLATAPRRMPRVLSLGGGLDSFAMLVEGIARGERPDIVVFIDVGHPDDPGEWPGTYKHVDEVVIPLCAREGIEFVRIDHTNYPVRDARSLFAWLEARHQIPVAGPNRICTRIAKVERFEAWLDDRFPGQQVEVWIGFESGEEERVAKDPNAGNPRGPSYGRKPSKSAPMRGLTLAWRWTAALAWAMTHASRVNRFPLMEYGMCRCACEDAVRAAGFPIPRKSACMMCPYGTKGDWQRFAVGEPAMFARVVQLEADKPPTAKNGRKLTIMAYSSKTQSGPPLDRWVMTPYTPQRDRLPCKVCGRAVRATKAAGCDYLEPAAA